jgi:hypothetical protein
VHMKTLGLIILCSLCACFVEGTRAQRANPDGTTARSEPVSLPPAPSVGGNGLDGPGTAPADSSVSSTCQLVEAAAAANGLPFAFFARVIRQESHFRSDAIGPKTRSGQRALGIAQFMPVTAVERSLNDPFDPARALPKSAEFLRELQAQFGNLGLAAAAYNAGPQHVRDWLSGKRALPLETQSYVRIVTGHSAQEWATPESAALAVGVPREMSCSEILPVAAKVSSPPAVTQPKQTPSWVVQLIGDRSELRALALFRQLQKKHDAILGTYEPDVMRTGILATWTRIRVDANSRQAAESVCSRLRRVGEDCLVQRN